MSNPYQSIIDQIRSNLSTHFEIQTKDDVYQIREVYNQKQWSEKTDGLKQYEWTFADKELVIGEDSNGNFFTICADEAISFLDHETDERFPICNSLTDFASLLKKPEEFDLPKPEIISVWVDPNFKPEFD